MIDPGSDGWLAGQCWANGRVADQMWRGVGVFMFPSSLSSPVWSVTSGRGCVGWQLKRCNFLKNTNIILGSWIITRAMAMQQKCHVLPEITRNARRKWLLENMWGKIGNRTRLNIFWKLWNKYSGTIHILPKWSHDMAEIFVFMFIRIFLVNRYFCLCFRVHENISFHWGRRVKGHSHLSSQRNQ